MRDLRERVSGWLRGQTCFVGVGSVARGDDGVGVRLAEGLRDGIGAEVILAGDAPERWLTRLAGGGHGAVVFLDAVDFGGAPGSVVVLDSAEVVARYPQVSTHKIGLGALASMIVADGGPGVWLLGVQPESVGAGVGLTPAVERTVGLLSRLFSEAVQGVGA